ATSSNTNIQLMTRRLIIALRHGRSGARPENLRRPHPTGYGSPESRIAFLDPGRTRPVKTRRFQRFWRDVPFMIALRAIAMPSQWCHAATGVTSERDAADLGETEAHDSTLDRPQTW